jgi:hypothetical protein
VAFRQRLGDVEMKLNGHSVLILENRLADAALGARAQGDGQLVLIVGEPGPGKSRLIGEFHA